MSKSSITTDDDDERGPFPIGEDKLPPIHVGEHLKSEMEFLSLSANRLAQALGVPANRISELVAGRKAMTADTALRLEKYGIGTADLWMNLQTGYELRLARLKSGEALMKIKPRNDHAA